MKIKHLETDILIIGGGTSGCIAAKVAAESSDYKIVVCDRSYINRSGCLAAGVNALNAYIGPDETVESCLSYIKEEFDGIIREDLVVSILEKLNDMVSILEDMGLPMLKNTNGSYAMRGKHSIKINGENIKPILAKPLIEEDKITLLEEVYILDLLTHSGAVVGGIGYSKRKKSLYIIKAKATLCTAGGAAGIYLPNNQGQNAHKMWYSPFNCGSGYAMGIRAGAEMTGFEMRFIALRIKNTIAPTGTIAQSLHSVHRNRLGEDYLKDYDRVTTELRLHATTQEEEEGRGPCYLDTVGIDKKVSSLLEKAYLNMAPSQTLDWYDKQMPTDLGVEITGTEPYIVGGHSGSGYWVDHKRRTTLKYLYAAGDVCGGSPKKYVTGCMAESVIAIETLIEDLNGSKGIELSEVSAIEKITNFANRIDEASPNDSKKLEVLELQMQKIMDTHAGGKSTSYRYKSDNLRMAQAEIISLIEITEDMVVKNGEVLVSLAELRDRLMVAMVVIAHLLERKETRWQCYQSNADYPQKDETYLCYINSRYEGNQIKMYHRPLVRKGFGYEHTN
ncbi:MAG: adenylylsulfate reductase [Firmicutes bacterium HGW-Firmicutes-2]|jgi:adenylylsulfate reductase subunit A|nr:MAG: adenylylsulfate reductase [Firmicutes bacterium HGW-Firmicutes-2]